MIKLYPPVIESTVSACYEENGMVKFTIPFCMNRAVSASQVGGFKLRIKTVQTGSFLYDISTINPANYNIADTESYVTFYLNDINQKLKVGQFYKVQLAYIGMTESDKNSAYNQYINGSTTLEEYENQVNKLGIVGYYSSAGTIKYTTKPNLYINNFSSKSLNEYTHTYLGYYSQEGGDISERVYSYEFNIYDSSGKNIVYSSGEQIHNNSLDDNAALSIDTYTIMTDLPQSTIYYIDYTVKTINKLIISSPKYRIIQRETIDPDIRIHSLNVELNFDNGYIDVSLKPVIRYYLQQVYEIINNLASDKYSWLNLKEDIIDQGFTTIEAEQIFNLRDKIKEVIYNDDEREKLIFSYYTNYYCTGSFVLCRADEDSKYSNWEELTKFYLFDSIPEGLIYRDFAIEQGKKYQYSLQQYNDYGLYSNRLYSDIILSDFEDAFLYDGTRQLKIKYNPKMNKFTNTVLEQKQETIGGKYPFIFRNGNVNYHEFPIAGLISYLSDEQFLFMTQEELNLINESKIRTSNRSRVSDPHFDSLSENITRERLFKTEVLNWLNNGNPKLFRSPTEGNFLVRLMKISLSPENKLGRMLHNFTSTAYEIAEYNNQSLQDLGIIRINDIDFGNQIKFFTKDLSKCAPGQVLNILSNNSLPVIINSIKCDNMFFGDQLLITYEDGAQENIQIGISGNYEIQSLKNIKGVSVLPRYSEKILEIVNGEVLTKIDWSNLYELKDGKYQLVKRDNFSIFQTYYQITNNPLKGLITFSYFEPITNNFANIKNINYPDPCYRQFIGEHDILSEIQKFEGVVDKKKELTEWYYIKADKRPIDKIANSGDSTDTLYYYGLDQYSNTLKINEIQYPVGMRLYEPNKYYFKNENNNYILLTEENIEEDTYKENYYMFGHYEIARHRIGQIKYEPAKYFIHQNGEYILATDSYNDNQVYYSQWKDDYGIIRYSVVKNMTINDDDSKYIFESKKFYRKTEDGNYYTFANTFYEEWQLNNEQTAWIKDSNPYYYEFIQGDPDNKTDERDTYHNAYITIDDKYLYTSRKFYIQVTKINVDSPNRISEETFNSGIYYVLEGDRSIKATTYNRDVYYCKGEITYIRANSQDFNIHQILEGQENKHFIVEREPYNKETFKYYDIKVISPWHIHQVGTYRKNNNMSQILKEYDNPIDQQKYQQDINYYNFNAINKFVDFYNNEKIYNEYQPWIEINGQKINIDDTLLFEVTNNLKNLDITSFKSGNGVVVEIGYQLKNKDYIVEDNISYKQIYENCLIKFKDQYDILLNKEHEDYLNLSEVPDSNKAYLYSQYENGIFEQNVRNAYKNLINNINI